MGMYRRNCGICRLVDPLFQARLRLRQLFDRVADLKPCPPASELRRNTFRASAAITAMALAGTSSAYETTTHSILTELAYERSDLFQYPGTAFYTGLEDPRAIIFTSMGKEGQRFLQTAKSTMARGAVYEDDFYGRIAFNHFFDPQFNNRIGRGLYIPGFVPDLLGGGLSSVDWALEDSGTPSTDVNSPAGNHFNYSYRKAQQLFYAGLTSLGHSERIERQSEMWQALGHVLHHIQDVAQPQHVRNEPHLHWDLPVVGNVDIPAGVSAYEQYTQSKNLDLERIATRTDYAGGVRYPLRFFGGIPPTARSLFHTPGVAARYIGMAEFTSQNFVTAFSAGALPGVPLVPTGFPLPSMDNISGSRKFNRFDPTTRSINGVNYQGTASYLIGEVYDENWAPGTANNVKLARSSLLSFLPPSSSVPTPLSMSEDIFDEHLRILIPRAVAFSAMLLNKFFGSRIGVLSPPADGRTWVINNFSGPLQLDGEFVMYGETAAGFRYELPYSRTMRSIPSAGTTTITLPTAPTGISKVIVVFRGRTGQEGDPTLASSFYTVTGYSVAYTPPAPPPPPPPPPPPATVACLGPFTETSAFGLSAGSWSTGSLTISGIAPNRVWTYKDRKQLGSKTGSVTITINAPYLRITQGTPSVIDILTPNESTIIRSSGSIQGSSTMTFTHSPATQGGTEVVFRYREYEAVGGYWLHSEVITIPCP